MGISEKVAYLKGLMEGMNLNADSNEGKLFLAIADVLDEIALEVEDLTDEVMELGDGLDVISDDLGDVEDIVYDEDEDDYEDEEDDEDDEGVLRHALPRVRGRDLLRRFGPRRRQGRVPQLRRDPRVRPRRPCGRRGREGRLSV